MALIKCPNCQKEISDKAFSCPSCGFSLQKEEPQKQKLICTECATEISEGVSVCPNCGCPIKIEEEQTQKVELTKVKLGKPSKKKKSIITICVIVVIAIIIGAFAISTISKQSYSDNLKKASSLMLTGAASAEDAGGLIHDVWYNTIYEERDSSTDKYTKDAYGDFNDSLSVLFADSTFSSQISGIKSNQDSVAAIMKELANPPREYQEAYTAIMNYYDAYLELTNLAINPTGSLTSFTSDFNTADSAVSKCYNTMQMYVS